MDTHFHRKSIVFASWSEGRHVDRWTVVHFLAGISGSALLYQLGITSLYGLATAFITAIVWEVYEAKRGIRESFVNRVSDVIIALIGYAVVAGAAPLQGINLLTISVCIVYVALCIHGWLAWKKRAQEKRVP